MVSCAYGGVPGRVGPDTSSSSCSSSSSTSLGAHGTAVGPPHPSADFAIALEETGEALDIRIGIHTGPVVGGVIGHKKFMYDLWGDTVNVAARLESHGESGKIQLSPAARAELGAEFIVEKRGEVTLKGKGPMTTYYLLAREAQAQAQAQD